MMNTNILFTQSKWMSVSEHKQGERIPVLIGDPDSKGVFYFRQAAKALNCPLEFVRMPYGDAIYTLNMQAFQGRLVKLDPPRYQCVDLMEANHLLRSYRNLLQRFNAAGITMLNAPQAILDTLDKRKCKQLLSGTGAAITPVLDDQITDMGTLRQLMLRRQTYRVFIKPVYGSGAGGVLAWQINPRNGREVLYSSAYIDGDSLINTKKLRRYENPEAIDAIGNLVLGGGAIVEKWMQKARHRDKSYDLRVVWQFGRIHYIIARQASGPITNLHLNNDALNVSELSLPAGTVEAIECLCRMAVQAFPGLNVAGIDILLTPGTLKPHIIEINAQGDLIYQDIYHDNVIYRAQVAYLQNCFKLTVQGG